MISEQIRFESTAGDGNQSAESKYCDAGIRADVKNERVSFVTDERRFTADGASQRRRRQPTTRNLTMMTTRKNRRRLFAELITTRQSVTVRRTVLT